MAYTNYDNVGEDNWNGATWTNRHPGDGFWEEKAPYIYLKDLELISSQKFRDKTDNKEHEVVAIQICAIKMKMDNDLDAEMTGVGLVAVPLIKINGEYIRVTKDSEEFKVITSEYDQNGKIISAPDTANQKVKIAQVCRPGNHTAEVRLPVSEFKLNKKNVIPRVKII